MRGFVHHVVLTVRNLEQAFPLYDSVLTDLGYRLEQKDEQGFGWYLETLSGSHSIHVARASEDGAKRRHDRYSPGLHHLAWKVDSRAEVDRMHERLLSVGATILDPPAEYPQYNKGRGYYVADGENDVVDKPSHVTDAPSPLHAGVVSRETLPKPYQTLTSQEHVAGKRSMRFRGRAQALPTRT